MRRLKVDRAKAHKGRLSGRDLKRSGNSRGLERSERSVTREGGDAIRRE